MTNEQILKKAIEKVVENGYKGKIVEASGYLVLKKKKTFEFLNIGIIFSHSFAKAFWGEEKWFDGYSGKIVNSKRKIIIKRNIHNQLAWQYHLQQMVISKNPLQYLKKFL